MDLVNGDDSYEAVTEPHPVDAARDDITTSCAVSCSTVSRKVSSMKRTGGNMNKQSSECLDGEHAKWLLTAVRRVRDQKQRPNIDRIMHALRIICPGKFHSRESVMEELELAVSESILLRVGAAGDSDNCSYRDPGRVVRLKSHSLRVTRDLDLTKFVARSVRELADPAGSTATDLHRYIRSGYNIEIHDGCDLMSLVVKYCQKAVEVGKLVCVEDSDESRYHAVYKQPKNISVNCTKTPSPSVSSYSLVDRAFKTDVSLS